MEPQSVEEGESTTIQDEYGDDDIYLENLDLFEDETETDANSSTTKDEWFEYLIGFKWMYYAFVIILLCGEHTASNNENK